MTKGSKIGLVIGGVGLLYWLSTKVYNIKNAITKLSAANPRIKMQLRGLQIIINVGLDIVNTSSVDVPFTYYAGDILHDGTKIASFNYNYQGQSVMIKARSVTPINDIIITISNVALLLRLTKVINALYQYGTSINTKLEVRSAIYAAGFDAPVNFLYDLKTQTVVSGVGIGAAFFNKKKYSKEAEAQEARRYAAEMQARAESDKAAAAKNKIETEATATSQNEFANIPADNNTDTLEGIASTYFDFVV